MEIRKGVLGLNQAVRIANECLTKNLQKYNYTPCPRTPALWIHNTLSIFYTLMVNVFGVKYTGKHNANHLVNGLRALYTIAVDHIGSLYCGLTLAWDHVWFHFNISMPNYIKQALHKFKHPLVLGPEDV